MDEEIVRLQNPNKYYRALESLRSGKTEVLVPENRDLILKFLYDAEIGRTILKGIQFKNSDGNILKGAVDYLLIESLKGNIIVIDYKTRGFPCKEDTHCHYQNQLDIYNFLLRKNGFKTEDFAFLLFYHPKEVLPTGEVVFNTELKKMEIYINNAEKIFENAIKLLNSDCPKKCCEWCDGR